MRCGCFGSAFFILGTVSISAQAAVDCNAIAKAQELSGDVRLKHAGVSNWDSLGNDATMRCGDLVYVGKGGNVRLFYLREKSNVSLPQQSIFEVEERLPVATKFKRSFGNSAYQGALVPRELSPDGKFSRTLKAPNRENMGSLEAELANGSANTVVERRVIPLRFVDPPGALKVVAQKFPVTISVVLDVPLEDLRVFGYLWNDAGSVAPVWTGTSTGTFTDILIDAPGSYIFQALSEDDAYASNTLNIEAEKRGQNRGPERILPGFWEGRYTVIFR